MWGLRKTQATMRRLQAIFSALYADLLLSTAEILRIISAISAEIIVYIWETDGWPRFEWQTEQLVSDLVQARHAQGRLLGRMMGLGFDLRSQAWVETLTRDVVDSSAIEGQRLDPKQVRSSIGRHLGVDVGALEPLDRSIEGVVEMTIDATQNPASTLDAERLFGWHSALFPTGRSGMQKILVGHWRDDSDGPMQVVSGPIGREIIHYQAPFADCLPNEMKRFLAWFQAEQDIDGLLKAGLAHLWFVTLHPFDDGNGRIARALTDMALARDEKATQRYYSLSSEIQKRRGSYYETLERVQKGSMDVTEWLRWHLQAFLAAVERSETVLAHILSKARFWEYLDDRTLNARQVKILNRLLDGGFEGKLTSSKWAKMAKCSQDTAHRDIVDLIERGALKKDQAGGRSTSYSVRYPVSNTDG